MKVISFNLNGIRAAAKKGFFTWLAQQDADVVCLQEIKAQEYQLTDEIFHPQHYHCYYHEAQKKGYSGVGLYTRCEPQEVIKGLGWPDIDAEGRYLEARFPNVSFVSLYVPSGTAGEHRQAVKFSFMERFMPYLYELRKQNREYVIGGDWNIAHREIDLKNWRANQNSSGFLPEERAWMEELFSLAGFVDAFRVVNQEASQYTWWSHRGRAWENNAGWRIDYQVISPTLRATVKQVSIYKEQRFSDHAPLLIDYDYSLV